MPTHSERVRAEREAAIESGAFRDYVVEGYNPETGTVTFDGNSEIGWKRDRTDVVPKEGDTLRLYGHGMLRFSGMDLNGEPIWFDTEEDHALDREEYKARQTLRHIEEYRRDRDKLDADYEALPRIFQLRIDKFRQTRPDWRFMYEGYEMVCCVDAVKIAEYVKAQPGWDPAHPEGMVPFVDEHIKRLADMKAQQLNELIPERNRDHSGNTWELALLLARLYLIDERYVVVEHGAMTPLTGCPQYGCPHPIPENISSEAEAIHKEGAA